MTKRTINTNLSCFELVELWDRAFGPKDNTDEFIENCQAVAEKTGNLNLFEEMFGPDPYNERGQDSAFMDDNFGG
jgi:hypothetical protein